MKNTKKKELNDIFIKKLSLYKNINLNKNKKYSIVSTLETQNSQKNKEKSNFARYSTKKSTINRNDINDSNEKRKKLFSFKGSSFPIFLSSMTNSRNKLNSFNNRFKSNSLANNSISNYSILNNSNVPNQKYEENGKSISIQSQKSLQKLDLRIKFPQLKNMNNLKLISSRSIKQNNFHHSEDKYIYVSNKSNDIDISVNNDSSLIHNKNEKHQNNSMDIDIERFFQLNKKIKEINDFVNSNKPRKKIHTILYRKINERINSSKKIEPKPNINQYQFKNNNDKVEINRSNKIIPKIIKSKNLSCGNIYSNSNNNIINISNKKNIINLGENENNPTSQIIHINDERSKKARKTKIFKKIEQIKHTTMILKRKLMKKLNQQMKFYKLIPNNDIIKNENDKEFINEVIHHNDSKEKDKQIKKNIKSKKIEMLFKYKNNLDKIISKKAEKLKKFNFNEEENHFKENEVKEIYKKKMNKYRKNYIELNSKSILYMLFFSYIYYYNKCGLDLNLLNYIVVHVEFSSIYLPIVKFRGQKEQMIINKKLFSYKKQKTLFIEEKSKFKFIELKKSKKKFQFITINYITKELINNNIDSKNNLYSEKIQIIQKKEEESSKKIQQNKLSRKKASYFLSNSYLSQNKKLKGFGHKHSSKKLFNIENPLKPLSLLNRKQFFKFGKERKFKTNLRNSIMDNLLFSKLSGKGNRDKLNESKYYIQKIISIIHENKTKRISSAYRDYFEILRRIKGKENIETILRTLIKEGEIALFNEYLYKNTRIIDINAQDDDGNSFLILSIKEGINPIITTLLERGIDVNIQNNEGNTALHYALSGKNFKIADLLEKYGAKEDLYNNYGMTPWDSVGKSIENN